MGSSDITATQSMPEFKRVGPVPFADEITALRATIASLEAGIEQALNCTPSIKVSGVTKGVTRHRIVYDCGDPWDILRALLNTGGANG